jgi:peptidoglycan/LPS O-acetylase OafA/YrhL
LKLEAWSFAGAALIAALLFDAARRKKNMHRFARPLLALAGWITAGAAHAHPGNHPHAHPHLDFYVIVLLLAVVAGIVWGVRQIKRNKRPPSE